MKLKKYGVERESIHTTQPQSHRKSSSSKQIPLTKRREELSNKENLVQITQPLDLNTRTYPSKQFVLSRESLQNNSRSNLKESNGKTNTDKKNLEREISKNYKKQQELFDRRLSLKCTGNYSQQIDQQKSQRLSMAPLRRDSLSSQLVGPHSLVDEKQSISSVYQNSLFCSDSKSKQVMKKQAIITNFMNKLDREQDLRSIIELKLKGGGMSSGHPHVKNQSYMTDLTDESNISSSMANKLRQCENEITYFKTVIRQMSQKIVELTEEKRFGKKKHTDLGESVLSKKTPEREMMALLRRTSAGVEHCPGCQCSVLDHKKQVGLQTSGKENKSRAPSQLNQSFDFLDNLQRTLKVLDGRRP